MDLKTTLIISFAAIAIYITFLVLGFSLKGKNAKAQNLENKNQIQVLIKWLISLKYLQIYKDYRANL